MDKIIRSRVIASSTAPLSAEDAERLRLKKARLLKFIMLGYLPLALVLAIMLTYGEDIIQRDNGSNTVRLNDEGLERFYLMVPWVCGISFLMLTIYFLWLYFQTLAPVLKDIKHQQKQLLQFSTEKSEMAAFDKFYILTPIRKNQLLRVEKEDFYRIDASRPLTLEIAPASVIVLGVQQDGVCIRSIDSFDP